MKGWRPEADIEKAERLQRVLQKSLGRFDKLVNCHQDLTPANILVDTSGVVHIIDYEWSGQGDRLCDLSTFCALSEQDDAGETAVLAEYLGVSLQDTPPLAKTRVRLWRTWFMLRSALWGRRKELSPYFTVPTGPD